MKTLAAAANGYACLSSWADLLDRINVFPIPDGDTGTNLKISLSPLREKTIRQDPATLPNLLLSHATGNSGNIAAAFLAEFLTATTASELAPAAHAGLTRARQAMPTPRDGTMLDVFSQLASLLAASPQKHIPDFLLLSRSLATTVQATAAILPELEGTGVVDAGALAMFIFFQGYFQTVTLFTNKVSPITDIFAGQLTIHHSWSPPPRKGHCLNALVTGINQHKDKISKRLTGLGQSIIINQVQDKLHVHMHSNKPSQVYRYLATLGEIKEFSDDDMALQQLPPIPVGKGPIHIMTDAAGSLTRQTALAADITLLDSYIVNDQTATPESLVQPTAMYKQLRQGDKIGTAQASTFERHQHFAAARAQYGTILYLAVGSAYTGNFSTALAWKKKNDPKQQFYPLDTGAASGRLALIALRTARYAKQADTPQDVVNYAKKMCRECHEFVFIDTLKYLVAGGRISRAKGFFGDLLHKKPIISPMPDGVCQLGLTKNQQEQRRFALDGLAQLSGHDALVLLQYSDNDSWISQHIFPAVQALLPEAEILIQPLSLTSGVHMGPGTWAVAFHGEDG